MDLAATRRMARNVGLRRLMAAWVAFYTGDYAYFVLFIIITYSAGGAAAVGAATVLNALPGGLLGPLAATLASGPRPQVHLAIGIGARGFVVIATIGAVLGEASVGVVLALVTIDSLVSAAVRPLHGALIVRLADTAAEAAAANAASSSLLNASVLVGPTLAGLVLGLTNIGWAFALAAAIYFLGMGAALLIRIPRDETGNTGARLSARSQLSAVGAGFRAIATRGPALAAATFFVINVMLLGIWCVAVAPVAKERLELGEGGVTTIMAIYGAGGLLGALGTLSIVGRRGLAAVLAGAMLTSAIALAVFGVIATVPLALVLAATVGGASAVAYALAPTLVQRGVTKDAMVPAAAGLQSLYLIGVSAGATIAPVLIAWCGVVTTLAIVSATVVVVSTVLWPRLRRADVLSAEDAAKLLIIRATPAFAPLPTLALEQLARVSTRRSVPAGAEVVREGDPGDRFYMIASGLADVSVDGRRVATLGRGGSFGEIALLQNVSRSATVTARDDLDLVAVDRAEFLGALSSNLGAVGGMGGVARARLATLPVEERLVELETPAVPVVELLASQPPLAEIGGDALGQLADSARVLAAPDGALITREGDYGCTYYVILEGAAQVLEAETPVRELGPGDGFGEQAIVRDVPRTATVRAVGDTTLVAVDREAFQRARQARLAEVRRAGEEPR